MSSKWRYAATFAGGLLVGALGAAAFVGSHWNRNFSNWNVLHLADQANVAREILSGNGPELAGRIKAGLPERVRSIQAVFGQAEGVEWALWMVRDVYEVAGTPPPSELQTILASLPPRPSCERPSPSQLNGDAPR